MSDSKSILSELQVALNHLRNFPYPYVPTPEGCRSRASVAAIIRVRPPYQPPLAPNGSLIAIDQTETPVASIDDFFSQSWVREGDPEILFIKRAGRSGDKWSGHVALPGGKRDPEDEDDLSAAIRETREEIGLDLTLPECFRAGNLPQRIVSGGRQPLMVLCPYIFLITSKSIPPVHPQPTEVAAAHWVPLRALLSPNLRTKEYVDTASRMGKKGGPVAQMTLRLLLGKMMLSAVRLLPSESVYASSIPGFVPEKKQNVFSGLTEWAFGVPSSTQALAFQQPLLLWGLTLGVLADFLEMLPPHNAVKLWEYPTFRQLDLRLLVYIFTYTFRKNNAGDYSGGTWPYKKERRRRMSQTALDATTQAVAVNEADPVNPANKNVVGIAGLGVGSNSKEAFGPQLLQGYYGRVNYAIAAFIVYRIALGSAAAYYLYKAWRKRWASLS